MAINLESSSELFITEVQETLQNHRAFAGVVLERHGLEGTTANFPVGGIGQFNEDGFGGGDIAVSALDETNVPISVGNFHYKTTIGGGYKTLFSYDKIIENAKQHGLAGARALDKLLIDALYNTGGGVTRFEKVPVNFGPSIGLSVAKLSSATDRLMDSGVSLMTNKNCLVPALARTDLKQDSTFSSWDFNMKRPLMTNQLPGYLDIAFYTVGSAGENAIPRNGIGTAGDPFVYDVLVLAEDSSRIVFNRELTSTINWNPLEDRWELVSSFTARGGVLLPGAIKNMVVHVVITP